MKRLGPELKVPKKVSDLKVPAFLENLYFDLRDRRLLPLVALVLVSIGAVPFLLSSDPEPLPSPQSFAEDAAASERNENSLVVVAANPGLRDYRKRLKGRTPTDPFAQPAPASGAGNGGDGSAGGSTGGGGSGFGGGPSPGGGASGGGATVEVDETEVEEIVEDEPGGGGGGGAGKPGGGAPGGSSPGQATPDSPTEPGLRFFSFRPDVRFGVAGSGDLILHKDLEVGRVLPKENPITVFVGVSEDGKRAAFDIAHEVTAVRGEGHCIGGRQNCSLLMLRSGEAANLVTATPGREFRLKVEEIEFVEVERPDPVKRKPAGTSRAVRGSWSFDRLAPEVVGQFQK